MYIRVPDISTMFQTHRRVQDGTYEFGSSTPLRKGRHRCGTLLATHCEQGSFLSHFCLRRWHSTQEKCTLVRFCSLLGRLTVDAASSSVCGSWLIDGFRSRLGDAFLFFELDPGAAAEPESAGLLSFLDIPAAGFEEPFASSVAGPILDEDGVGFGAPAGPDCAEKVEDDMARACSVCCEEWRLVTATLCGLLGWCLGCIARVLYVYRGGLRSFNVVAWIGQTPSA